MPGQSRVGRHDLPGLGCALEPRQQGEHPGRSGLGGGREERKRLLMQRLCPKYPGTEERGAPPGNPGGDNGTWAEKSHPTSQCAHLQHGFSDV